MQGPSVRRSPMLYEKWWRWKAGSISCWVASTYLGMNRPATLLQIIDMRPRLTLEQEKSTQHKFKHTVPDSLQHAGAALETSQRTAHVKRALRRCCRNPFRHACSFRKAFSCICQWDNCIYVKGVRRSRRSGDLEQSVRKTQYRWHHGTTRLPPMRSAEQVE